MVTVREASVGDRLEELRRGYAGLEGPALLQPLVTRIFPGRIALVSSFGAESAVLLHMVASVDRRTPVIFLNTGKLFGETLAYRETLVERLGLMDVRDIRPDPRQAGRQDPEGMLWNSDPDACCHLRKVVPLRRALTGFCAWITGRKRFHGGARAQLETFEADGERIKVNPLAGWSAQRIRDYLQRHELPLHPLLEKGYLSVGCAPCTVPAALGDGPRSGRWRGLEKSECGIHFVDGRPRPARREDRSG
ncbi:MAG: phosphoadenylyl-sulfate reductase [Methyloligellaceae bacterium]